LIQNSKFKIQNSPQAAFTLIELLVAMFILIVVVGGMVAVGAAGFRSYQKSRAIKTVTEDIGFAINSIVKDVRMGKIMGTYATGGSNDTLMITRNSDQVKICYFIARGTDSDYLAVSDNLASGAVSCSGAVYDKKIVDLSDTGMKFDSTAGFRSCVTDNKGDGTVTACNGVSDEKRRGWAEINLNIGNPTMETDSINVQSIVSSRDYGWEETP